MPDPTVREDILIFRGKVIEALPTEIGAFYFAVLPGVSRVFYLGVARYGMWG